MFILQVQKPQHSRVRSYTASRVRAGGASDGDVWLQGPGCLLTTPLVPLGEVLRTVSVQ